MSIGLPADPFFDMNNFVLIVAEKHLPNLAADKDKQVKIKQKRKVKHKRKWKHQKVKLGKEYCEADSGARTHKFHV